MICMEIVVNVIRFCHCCVLFVIHYGMYCSDGWIRGNMLILCKGCIVLLTLDTTMFKYLSYHWSLLENFMMFTLHSTYSVYMAYLARAFSAYQTYSATGIYIHFWGLSLSIGSAVSYPWKRWIFIFNHVGILNNRCELNYTYWQDFLQSLLTSYNLGLIVEAGVNTYN